MAGQARSGFAMDVVGQSSRSSSASTAKSNSHLHTRHNAFREDDEEDDHLQRLHRKNGSNSRHGHSNGKGNTNTDELLSGYSQSRGAEKVRKSPPRQGPRVIAKQADLNWMEERKRRLGLERYREELGSLTSMRTPGSTAKPNSDQVREAAAERIGDGQQLSGLQIQKKSKSREEDEEMEDIKRSQEGINEDHTPTTSQAGESPNHEGESREDREDEAARMALLSGQGLGASFRTEEERIIPISEEEALKRDTDTRPEPPSMSDYAKMPVQEFGAALLRGMGWKEGMGAGKNKQGPTSAPEVKKRAALLGLGAKERKVDEQVGVKAKNFKIERPERKYIPLTRIEREKEKGSQNREIEVEKRRERSRSPSRKRRERDDAYDRRDDRRHREKSDREYTEEYERERERRKRREREREREREHERPYHSSDRSDRR